MRDDACPCVTRRARLSSPDLSSETSFRRRPIPSHTRFCFRRLLFVATTIICRRGQRKSPDGISTVSVVIFNIGIQEGLHRGLITPHYCCADSICGLTFSNFFVSLSVCDIGRIFSKPFVCILFNHC